MKALDSKPRRMARRSAAAVLALFAMAAVRAAPAMTMTMEVNFLLGYVEGSGCDFQRNGSWHTAAQAQVHLREKFNYLVARNRLDTAEQFIERAATESSLTGRAYLVRCNGGPTISSRQWLGDELSRLRKTR